MPYEWRCQCGDTFAAEPQGYHDAQVHQSEAHGSGGNILGLYDTATSECVVEGFGPRVLSLAQRKGFIVRKTQGKAGTGEEAGGDGAAQRSSKGRGESLPSNVRKSDIGVRTKQAFREVWLDLPLLESLFQRARATFAEGWTDDDGGFSAWLHDTIIHAYRPLALQLFGMSRMDVEAMALQAHVGREELAELILKTGAIPESEMPRVVAVLYESAMWGSLVGPHYQRRAGAGGHVA